MTARSWEAANQAWLLVALDQVTDALERHADRTVKAVPKPAGPDAVPDPHGRPFTNGDGDPAASEDADGAEYADADAWELDQPPASEALC